MLLPHLLKQLHQVLTSDGEGLRHCQAACVEVDGLQIPVFVRCQDSPLVVCIASWKACQPIGKKGVSLPQLV